MSTAAAALLGRLAGCSDFSAVTGRAVIACSGGPDSLALLAVAAHVRLDGVAVHVDHGLRPGSAGDADRVRAAARRFGVAFRSTAVAVGSGPNLEARARDARYRALDQARRAEGATHVLVGHTMDDQAETVLLALMRGSASAGLAGMRPCRGTVVRPFLRVRRAETRALVEALELPCARDPMNEDPAFRRVRVRRELVPLLDSVAQRDMVPVLARQADILREESDLLDAQAHALLAEAGSPEPVAAVLAGAPLPLRRRAVRCWLGSPPPSAADVERVLEVVGGRVRAAEIAGGRRVERSGGRMRRPVGAGRGRSGSVRRGSGGPGEAE